MKSLLTIAIAMASLTVNAQSTTTTTATKNTATADSATAQPAGAPAAPVSQIGSSTASVEQKPADDKKWSATLMAQTEVKHEGLQRIGEQTVGTVNYLGAGYKVTKDTKVGFRQYFGYDIGRESNGEASVQWTALTLGTKFAGILGSDEIAPLFWYYMPTDYALQNVYSKTETPIHNGIARLDAEVVWTLNPKVSVSYYFNPRQSVVPYRQAFIGNDGSPGSVVSTTTLIHYAVAYYNVNDAVQPYAYIGEDNRVETETGKVAKDNTLLAIGANFTTFGGKLLLNPEIYNEVAQGDQMLENSEMNYQLTAALSF